MLLLQLISFSELLFEVDGTICPSSIPGDWEMSNCKYYYLGPSDFKYYMINCPSGMRLAEWRTLSDFNGVIDRLNEWSKDVYTGLSNPDGVECDGLSQCYDAFKWISDNEIQSRESLDFLDHSKGNDGDKCLLLKKDSKLDKENCDSKKEFICQSNCEIVGISYSGWTAWTTCTKTCERGTRTRSASCSGGGASGTHTELEYCNDISCDVTTTSNLH